MSKKTLLLLWILTTSIAYSAGQGMAWKHFTIENGLPSSNVYAVIQDHKGYIWMATDRGVAKYNGYEFKTFTTRNGLPMNDVWGIGEGKDGKIWLGMKNHKAWYIENDSVRYDEQRETGSFYFNGIDFNGNPYFSSKIQTEDNVQWFYCLNDNRKDIKWYRINNKSLVFGKVGVKDEVANGHDSIVINLPDKFIPHVVLSNRTGQNYYIQATCKTDKNSYILRWDKSSNTTKELYSSGIVSISAFKSERGEIDSIFFYSKSGQTLSFSGESGTINYLSEFYNQKSINGCYKDYENNYWLYTSNDGLWMLPSDARNTLTYSEIEDLKGENILSLTSDNKGRLFIGTASNNLLLMEENKIKKIPKPTVSGNAIDYEIILDSKGNLYSSGGYILTPEEYKGTGNKGGYLFSKSGKDICVSENEQYIYSCYLNKYNIFNIFDKQTIPAAFPDSALVCYAISKSFDDKFWLGSTNGLFVYSSDGIKRFNPNGEPFWSSYITDIVSDFKHKRIWVSSEIHGMKLIALDTVQTIRELDSKNISHLHLDKKGNVWVSTSDGVFRVEITSEKPFEYRLKHWGIGNGILSREVTCTFTDSSCIYVGTPLGLSVLPQNEENVNAKDIPVYIEKIAINGRDTLFFDGKYELTRTQSEIKIQFAGLLFSNLGELFYEYSINGSPFRKIKERELTLAGLQPGDYEIVIYALDENGNKSKTPARLQFYIKPYFTETKAFIGLMVLLTLIVVGLIVLFRIRYLNTELDFKKRYVLLKLQALQSQMNPHFVFNALNGIQNFIMSQNKEAANEYLTRFARLMRLFLESSREHFISLSQEIDMLHLYTDLEQMRFRDKFEVKFEVAEDLDLNQEVPSMLLQPFVENAINHGLIYLKEKGLLTLSFETNEAENLIIKIDDNGVGRKAAAIFKSNRTGSYKSRAMEIVQQRIETINESKEGDISLEIIDKTSPDGSSLGTCVLMVIRQI